MEQSSKNNHLLKFIIAALMNHKTVLFLFLYVYNHFLYFECCLIDEPPTMSSPL